MSVIPHRSREVQSQVEMAFHNGVLKDIIWLYEKYNRESQIFAFNESEIKIMVEKAIKAGDFTTIKWLYNLNRGDENFTLTEKQIFDLLAYVPQEQDEEARKFFADLE